MITGPRNQAVLIHVTPEVRDKLREAAKKSARSVSAYGYLVLRDHFGVKDDDTEPTPTLTPVPED